MATEATAKKIPVETLTTRDFNTVLKEFKQLKAELESITNQNIKSEIMSIKHRLDNLHDLINETRVAADYDDLQCIRYILDEIEYLPDNWD